MSLIRPFTGLRPVAGRAADVVAPPYDVLSTVEARQRAAGRPWSFLHISRPEVDLPEGIDPYSDEVYAKAAENLEKMINEGVLVRDPSDSYYAYRLTMGTHVQTGLVAAASVEAYDADRITFVGRGYQGDVKERIRAQGKLVIPGLINHHMAFGVHMQLFRLDALPQNLFNSSLGLGVQPERAYNTAGPQASDWRASAAYAMAATPAAAITPPAIRSSRVACSSLDHCPIHSPATNSRAVAGSRPRP